VTHLLATKGMGAAAAPDVTADRDAVVLDRRDPA
jgi:hypothetical protein